MFNCAVCLTVECGVCLTVECGVCLTMPCGHVLGCVRALCLHRYTENHRSCFGVKTGTVLGCAQFWGVLSFGVYSVLGCTQFWGVMFTSDSSMPHVLL